MRDDKLDNISETNFNIIVNLHPTDGTHWVLVIRREDGPTYYFDSFGVETPPLFLEEYVDLGSNERIQQYDESYCGAYCLYMIYLIDRGFRIKSALNILVNQVKCPEKYNVCLCLGCNVKVKYNVHDNDLRCSFANNDNVNDNQGTCFADDLQSSFANNDNVIHNDLRSSFANSDKDNVIDNDNVNDLRSNFANNDNDLRSSFANQGTDGVRGMATCSADNDNDNVKDLQSSFTDNVIYQFDEKHQKGKPNNKECPTNTISININEDLQS